MNTSKNEIEFVEFKLCPFNRCVYTTDYAINGFAGSTTDCVFNVNSLFVNSVTSKTYAVSLDLGERNKNVI